MVLRALDMEVAATRAGINSSIPPGIQGAYPDQWCRLQSKRKVWPVCMFEVTRESHASYSHLSQTRRPPMARNPMSPSGIPAVGSLRPCLESPLSRTHIFSGMDRCCSKLAHRRLARTQPSTLVIFKPVKHNFPIGSCTHLYFYTLSQEGHRNSPLGTRVSCGTQQNV